MKKHRHGETEKHRGRNKGNGSDQQRRLGSVQRSSSINGAEPFRVNPVDSSGENPDWKLTPIRDTTAGKILERLDALEKRHLRYVNAHCDRLKARLGEGEDEINEFVQEANQIKADIYHLATRQDKPEEQEPE